MRSAMEVTTNFPDPWAGGAWHPRDIMQMELIASHAALSLASNYRADYLRNFYGLGKENLAPIKAGEPLGYVIWAGQGRDENVAKLVGALVEQSVEVYRLDRELHGRHGQFVIKRAAEGQNRAAAPSTLTLNVTPDVHEIPAGSYIVFLNQPYRSNVEALFEPQIYPDRVTATGEAERPYDVAGWTLPMMMGLEASPIVEIREAATERRLTLVTREDDVRKDLALPLWTTDKSPTANPIKPKVRIGIYQNSRAGNMDEGWTRYVFDTFNIPFESIGEAAVNQASPSAKFDVMVLPSEQTRPTADTEADDAAARGISAQGYANLARFVEDGGTLICFDGSCGAVIRQMKLPLKNVLDGLRSSDFYCPGSVLRVDVDTANPIARGMYKETDAYFINSSAFEATDKDRVRVIARYANENLLRSGWLRGEDKLKNKIALAEVTIGKGRVVLFGFRPQHRGQTWGTFPFIWNAINLAARP